MSYAIRSAFATSYDSSIRTITQRQTDLTQLQDQLTSGKKIVTPSDDPTGAAAAERALTRINRIATDQRALGSQKDALSAAENTLGNVQDALQSFRELVVSAGNATYTPKEYKTVALQLQGLRDEIFNLANTSDTNGQPLFGALGSALAPFVGPQPGTTQYTFNGLPGQTGSTAVSLPFNLDGEEAFMLDPKSDASYNVTNSATSTQLQATGVSVTDPTAVTGSSYAVSGLSVAAGATAGTSHMSYTVTETPAGGGAPITTTLTTPDYNSASTSVSLALPNGASATGGLSLTVSGTPSASDAFTVAPNSSLFSVLDNAIAAIGSATTGATVKQAVSQALGNIDKSADKIAAARGRAGELLTRADRISTSQDKRSTDLQAARSSAEDLDMISAISEFQNKQTGYQAALQSYAQIQKNSLFNYIG